MKPNTSGIQGSIKAIKPFFSSFGGMTGSSNSNYHDVLVLDTYSDSSGGGPNAMSFDKGNAAGNPEMYIWKGAWGGTTWGTGQRVFADNYHPNADTLTTARTIGGVSFNGSANIDLPGVNTAGNQNTSGTAGGLSGTPNISVGTITSDTIEINTAINDNSHGLLISNGSLSGAGNLRIAIPKASGNYSTASQLGGITIRNETTGGNIVVGAKDHVIIGVGGSDYDERLKATTAGVDITGALTATTKSFDIEHPSKEGMRLRYGSLEGPENGVYVRGKSQEKVILLPDYWPDLIHEDSITVQLTAIGGGQELYVEKIEDNKVYVNGDNYFYYIQAERKDVERFEVEYSE